MRAIVVLMLVGCAPAANPYCVDVVPRCDEGTPLCRIGELRWVGSHSDGTCTLTGFLPGGYPTCNDHGEAECPHESYTLACVTDAEMAEARDDCEP